MLSEIFTAALGILKGIISNPARMFKDMEREEYDYSVYFMFLLSALITFFKSFHKERQSINFFSNDIVNKTLSFFSIPQIQWLISFLCFVLLIFLTGIFCRYLLKRCEKRKLTLCFLSISSVGILLQILFFALNLFLSQKSVYALRWVAFSWIVYLSIVAIRNSQNASYVKSVTIYIFSALPVMLIIGLTGLAPFLLFLL